MTKSKQRTETLEVSLAEEPLPKLKRDHKAEAKAAKSALAHKAASIRIARDANDLEVMQIAQALILCGLPYQPTEQTRLTRKARLADGSEVLVTFSVALGSAMPYGSDRTLLYFLLDRAVKSGSRFVEWSTATEFLTTMGMGRASGKNYSDLRLRFQRLRGLVIGVERKVTHASASTVMPIIRRSVLPSSMEVGAEARGQKLLSLENGAPYGVEIDEVFFDDLKRFHVPVPTQLLAQTRKQSQLQDNVLFLYWRSFAARSESLIPWESLRQQLWQDDSNERRIKVRFAEAIKVLRTMWPEIQAESRKEGLWIAPPTGGRYFLPQGQAARRLN